VARQAGADARLEVDTCISAFSAAAAIATGSDRTLVTTSPLRSADRVRKAALP
jgi:hypothetical protein